MAVDTLTEPREVAVPPMAEPSAPPIDSTRLEAFLGRVVTDWGAGISMSLVRIGDKLGLYKAMANSGPVTPEELADRTSTNTRYIREWLINQAAGGYVEYDAATGRYHLPPEHAIALADENSPYFVGGGFQNIPAMMRAEPRISEAFRHGGGMLWGEHHEDLFEGTERLFRPAYIGHLVQDWIPALDGVQEKLERGARVADVGCGHGASTIIMAQAYPRSTFHGFDNHPKSIERAHAAARAAGVQDRVTFEVADCTKFPGEGYDFIAFFDCYHDLADPAGAARRAFGALASDGTVMIVEPMAGDDVQDNLNPLGRVFSGASVLCCTPNSMASGGPALGTIASDRQIEQMVKSGGFSRFRRATETPFNRVFEARR